MSNDTFRIDLVDEASAESFPASDAPSFTGLHAGAPSHEEELGDAMAQRGRWPRPIVIALGLAAGALVAWIGISLLRRVY